MGKGRKRICRRMCFVAGGTGLTPFYQIACSILRDPNDNTKMVLLYANQSPNNILLRDQLFEMVQGNPDRFKLWLTVDKVQPGVSWSFGEGFIDEDMLRKQLYPPNEGTIVLIC